MNQRKCTWCPKQRIMCRKIKHLSWRLASKLHPYKKLPTDWRYKMIDTNWNVIKITILQSGDEDAATFINGFRRHWPRRSPIANHKMNKDFQIISIRKAIIYPVPWAKAVLSVIYHGVMLIGPCARDFIQEVGWKWLLLHHIIMFTILSSLS